MQQDRSGTEMRFVNNFRVDECSIPEGMTLTEWRRANAPPRRGLGARVVRLRKGRPAAEPRPPADGSKPAA